MVAPAKKNAAKAAATAPHTKTAAGKAAATAQPSPSPVAGSPPSRAIPSSRNPGSAADSIVDDDDPSSDEDDTCDENETHPSRGLQPMPRRESDAPLAPDLTPAEVAADSAAGVTRRQEVKTRTKKTKTTQDTYATALKKWFPLFCLHASWKIEDSLTWLNDAGACVADGTFRQFFKYAPQLPPPPPPRTHPLACAAVLSRAAPSSSSAPPCPQRSLDTSCHRYLHETPNMTWSIFKNCLAWAQWELNNQLSAKMQRGGKDNVGGLPGVKHLRDEVPPPYPPTPHTHTNPTTYPPPTYHPPPTTPTNLSPYPPTPPQLTPPTYPTYPPTYPPT
jgi:hypothetical protein